MKLNLFLLTAAAMVNAATAGDTLPLDIGTAGDYVLLAEAAITGPSVLIDGDIGCYKTAAAITGYALTMDGDGDYSTSSSVTGQVHAPEYSSATKNIMKQAVKDMVAAHDDAMSRPSTDSSYDRVGVAAGGIGGQTLLPGVYTFSSYINIATDLTFKGGPDDVWIIKTANYIVMTAAMDILLVDGAQAKNIFWVAENYVSLGANVDFAGIILSKGYTTFGNPVSHDGRILSQTAITIPGASIVEPPMTEDEVFC
jgi:hypothetical protein